MTLIIFDRDGCTWCTLFCHVRDRCTWAALCHDSVIRRSCFFAARGGTSLLALEFERTGTHCESDSGSMKWLAWTYDTSVMTAIRVCHLMPHESRHMKACGFAIWCRMKHVTWNHVGLPFDVTWTHVTWNHAGMPFDVTSKHITQSAANW